MGDESGDEVQPARKRRKRVREGEEEDDSFLDESEMSKIISDAIKKSIKMWEGIETGLYEEQITDEKPSEIFTDPKDILAPLNDVIMEPKTMDLILERTAIPDLIFKRDAQFSGAVLYGPTGCGKSLVLKSIREAYKRAGAFTKSISPSSLMSPWFGVFEKGTDTLLEHAVKKAEERGKPSFILFDEGDILIMKGYGGLTAADKAYMGVVDALKRRIGNEKNLVVGISTNIMKDYVEDALVREGRLTSIFVDNPGPAELVKLWKFYNSKYNLLDLSEDQYNDIAEMSKGQNGSLVQKFCETYLNTRRNRVLKERNFSSLLDALKVGIELSDEDIRKSMSYNTLLKDLQEFVEVKKKESLGKYRGLMV